jgi:NitT/TauT family transport system permease protein
MTGAGSTAAGAAPEALVAQREVRLQALLAPPRRTFWERHENVLITLASLVIVLSTWEAVTRSGLVRPTLLAGPSQIVEALARLASTGLLWKHLSYSAINFFLGFTLAAVVGIPLALIFGTRRRVATALTPYVMGLNSVPRISFISLMIVWFGLGIQSKVVLIFLSAFFPILITTWSGVRVVDPILVRAGRAYGAHGWQLFRRVIIPYSIPFIMSGMRLGVGRALIGVVGSELYGTDFGLGFLIITSGFNFRVPELFAGVVLLAAIGIAMTEILEYAERRIAPWRETYQR